MVVMTQSKGRGVTGLNVGTNNVQRYFPKERFRSSFSSIICRSNVS